MQSKIFSVNKTLNVGGRLVDLSTPKVMGILNVTPDSFYDGKRYADEKSALEQAEKMLIDGADFIDVGGYSTRPGAEAIAVDEELSRVLPVVKSIAKKFPQAIVSIDTFRAAVAERAVQAGAMMINDVSGGSLDDQMFSIVAALKVPYVLMHMRGNPQTMTQQAEYDNLIKDITDYFHAKLYQLHKLGVKDIILDPGFGFAKTVDQNFDILRRLDHFQLLGRPLLVGLSRKSMVWKTLNTNPDSALNGTTVLNSFAIQNGASILRVHDVREATECIRLVKKMRE